MSGNWGPRVIEVIETSLELRGNGTVDDPFRRVRQYYTLGGKLLAERDEWRERPEAVDAVDPSATNPGTLTTREKPV